MEHEKENANAYCRVGAEPHSPFSCRVGAEPQKIVFIPNGRLGNAIFRYMACALLNILNPSLEYCLPHQMTELGHQTTGGKDDYVYYAGLDHEGDDIHNRSKAELESDLTVVAYNTLGFYKHTVDVDKLTSNKYINKENGHGLYVRKIIKITDDNFFSFLNKDLRHFTLLMDGYFQFGHIYLTYKKEILTYMEANKHTHFIQTDLKEKIPLYAIMDDMTLPSLKQYDAVIHIRLGDFNGRPDFIETQHYIDLFNSIHFETRQIQRICIICDTITSHDDSEFMKTCVRWFHDRAIDVTLERNDVIMDFNIMKHSKLLVCSMSTLSWAAAYVSTQAQECYMPDYNFYTVPQRRSFFFRKPCPTTHLYPVKTTVPSIAAIKPIIITLPDYAARLVKLNDLQRKLSSLGLETEVYNGVNGKHITWQNSTIDYIKYIHYENTTFTYDATVRENQTSMKLGEFGCAMSHLTLLKRLIEEPDHSIKYYLILEDDVELVRPIEELYTLLKHIPEDMDMCHVALSDWYPFVKTKQVNAFFYECEKAYFNRTTAYLISRKGAEKVLAYSNNHINIPIDDLYCTLYRETSDYHFYVPCDFFFKEQENVVSTIADVNRLS